MFTVSEKAREKVEEFFKDRQELSPIRIVKTSGCCGPSLRMVLDEPQEDDEVFDDDGITYVINSQLFEWVKPIHVDFVSSVMGSGFSISSSIPAHSSSASSCSC